MGHNRLWLEIGKITINCVWGVGGGEVGWGGAIINKKRRKGSRNWYSMHCFSKNRVIFSYI